MKHYIISILLLFFALHASSQRTEYFAMNQLKTYPKSHLIDLYKSAFQDFMGAEHLVVDQQRAKQYLDEELSALDVDEMLQWYYEPCGVDSNYYRVSLRAVKEKVITAEQLLDAFLRSANHDNRPAVSAWKERWNEQAAAIDQLALSLPDYQQERAFIDSVLAAGQYALSHSADYREAYAPHYRIVKRDVFEKELKPLLEKYQKADANGYIVFEGEQCPDFTVTLTDGRKVTLSELKGKVVMLQFTASWCSVCRREMPFIERDIWLRHKDNPDFVLIGIDRDEPLAKVLKFRETTGITYPLGLDPGADIYAKFALRESGITRNVLIDRDGVIVKRTRLYNEEEFASLVSAIDQLLEPAHCCQ